MSREIEFSDVRFTADQLVKGNWAALKNMLDSLSDEEIEKIPDIEQGAIEYAERYGVCDIIDRNGKWINIYWIAPYIMKGNIRFHNLDD